MNLHYLSDLHLESGPYALPAGLKPDVVVAAGDISSGVEGVRFLAKLDCPVVYVAGNHEFWPVLKGDGAVEVHERWAALEEAAKGTSVHLLRRGRTVVIGGVRFIGATLWTDFGNGHPEMMGVARYRLRDYSFIRASHWWSDERNVRKFNAWAKQRKMDAAAVTELRDSGALHPYIVWQWHREDLRGIARSLRKPFEGPTVVVTHHAPLYEALLEAGVSEHYLDKSRWVHRFRDDSDLYRFAAYASDLSAWLEPLAKHVDVWMFGHLHHAVDFAHHGVRFVSNPRGRFLPALTKAEADAFSLFGYRVTDEDIARSQREFAADPFRGDGFAFDASRTLRPEEGALPALSETITRALAETQDKVEEVRELLPLATHDEPLLRRSVQEAVSSRVDAIFVEWRKAVSHVRSQVFGEELFDSAMQWDQLGLVELSPNICHRFRGDEPVDSAFYRDPAESAEDLANILQEVPLRLAMLPKVGLSIKAEMGGLLQPVRDVLSQHGYTVSTCGPLFERGYRLADAGYSTFWVDGPAAGLETVVEEAERALHRAVANSARVALLRAARLWVRVSENSGEVASAAVDGVASGVLDALRALSPRPLKPAAVQVNGGSTAPEDAYAF